ncbi:heme-degrading domain-containing protein [Viridibacterium curvum]|uniref:UPF0303 protein GCM10025770_17440 n=1 Tax=Viridibacterium curvum TaxID=1101404 RepID=A0ABP9QLW9_9RHOO
MTHDEELALLARQEDALQFDSFNARTAWQIGHILVELLEARGKKAAISIGLTGQQLFYYAMPGTTPDNGEWARRKRNVVERFHRSSFSFKLNMEKNNYELTPRYGLSPLDYALSPGGFPIRLKDTGIIGSIGVSGLPPRDDHGIIIEALAKHFGLEIERLALPDA